jgi:hypothetical protein
VATGKGRRQLVGFWWVLAFMLGAAAGALSSNLIGMPYTAWWIIGFCGSAVLVVGIAEWFGQGRQSGHNAAATRWRPPARTKFSQPPQRILREKGARRRGQLHAINGRKMADPPS